MDVIDINLSNWKDSLCDSVNPGGLLTRNPTVHKWKAPFRCLSLRESVAWRTQDLLQQSKLLFDSDHLLGARILLRSAFETLAVLIYMNQLMRSVVTQELSFKEFSDKTTKLLLGSRDGSTDYSSINILTILEKCNKRYPGILKVFEGLCESAHPNYEGMSIGYSTVDYKEYETNFSNRWGELYSSRHCHGIEICLDTFHLEYHKEWIDAFEKLEKWMEENDAELEENKDGA